ncbi:MAG: DUF4160 domain-containing protein [Anaerolineaceae bacterium]|nr:DUF4160 domain-containing protein [Anaerolineaceae bacterium]
MAPLVKWRDKEILVVYSEYTTIGDFRDIIFYRIYGKTYKEIFGPPRFTFYVGSDRAEIEDPNKSFAKTVEKYIDPNHTGKMQVCFLVCHDAGVVWRQSDLRFSMHSHEGVRHNEPHVHVEHAGYQFSASVSIIDYRVLDGKIPRKKLKEARKIITENYDYFVDCWNKYTDGIRIDINHGLGLIGY